MEVKFLVEMLLVVIITYLIIFYVVLVQWSLAKDYPPKVMILDQFNLKTGDILVVGYKNVFGLFVTAWSQSLWSHTGIVWRNRKTNELYVIEAANYGGNYDGAFKIPFYTWLKINGKSNMALLRYTGCSFPEEELLTSFEKYSSIKLDCYSAKWARFLTRRALTGPIKDRNSYTCYEMTVCLLQEIGVIKKKYKCSSYFPREFINLNLDLEEGHSYESFLLK